MRQRIVSGLQWTVALLAPAALAHGCAPAQPPISAEADSKTSTRQQNVLGQLQGRWMAVDNRTMMPNGERMFFCFQGNMVCSMRDEKRDDWLPFSIDAAKDPMWIDIDAMKGLFRLENDRLTICFGVRRPANLCPEGEPVERYVLKRAVLNDQPDNPARAEQHPDPDAQCQHEGTWIPAPTGRGHANGIGPILTIGPAARLWRRVSGTAESRRILGDWPLARPRSWLQNVNQRRLDRRWKRCAAASSAGSRTAATPWSAPPPPAQERNV